MDRRGLMRPSRISFAVTSLYRRFSVGSAIAAGNFIIFPANKVGKSRDGRYPGHKKKEGKTFRRAALAKEIVRVFVAERRLDSARPRRRDAMRNWIGTLSSFRTFGFRLPSTNNGHPDARATGGGEFAF